MGYFVFLFIFAQNALPRLKFIYWPLSFSLEAIFSQMLPLALRIGRSQEIISCSWLDPKDQKG
jgi:hypothetical protein